MTFCYFSGTINSTFIITSMKKIYLLSLLCCLGFAAFSQPVTVTIYASGLSGSHVTGNVTSTSIYTDGNIVATNTAPTRRGYAVFDIASGLIPNGSVVNSVVVGYNVSAYTAGTIAGTSTNVYVGDLGPQCVTPATLYGNMIPPSAPSVSAVAYTAGVGNKTILSTAGAVAAVQANLSGKLSWCWTHTGTAVFTITGETGILSTAGAHAPYIQITYCPPPTGVTATATPNPLCEGDVLTLTGTGTGVSGGYTWTGPGGYTSTLTSPTLTASLTSAGVYTLSAVNSCTTYSATATATSAFVTVNPLPAAITGGTSICTGDAYNLSDATLLGTWSSSDPSKVAIGASTGLASGVSAGAATITYMLGTGCYVTSPMTDNDPPDVISGPTEVCVNSTITLTNTVGGGTWTSGALGVATVDPVTGVVTGVSAGNATITYTTGGCPAVTHNVTVNPLPAVIGGPGNVCEGATISLTDGSPGGSWTSSNITIAMINSLGVVTGISPGNVIITYTLPVTGCQITKGVTVNPLPAAITGPTEVCVGSVITLADATPLGAWSSSALAVATINIVTGDVTGVAAGTADMIYTIVATGCSISSTITVNPLPAPPSGTTVFCQNTTTTLTDSDPGGVWTSSNILQATVGTSSGIVTGVGAGTPTITYTLPTGCYNTAGVTVNPAPLSVITPAGPTTFCTGGNVVLNASTGAGYTYQWHDGGTPIPGETNSAYTAATSGSFTVDVTNTFGCTTTSTGTVVTAGILPVITYVGSPSFCVGQSIVLTANTGGATGTITYEWYKDGALIPAAIAVNYTASTSGVYYVKVSISGGSGTCVVSSANVTVNVHPLPTPVINYIGTATLSTFNGYSGYQWYLNTLALPGATNSTYVPLTNGSYRVQVSDGIGCKGYSPYVLFTNVGVKQINVADLKIYPNPATDVINIESPSSVRAVITGVEGKKLIEVDNAKSINISSLTSGLYIIMLYDASGEMLAAQKLIKN
jgi:trimeric autotransporter adhesin